MAPLTLDRRSVRELDRVAIQDFGISGLVLMENAGRGCADCLCELGISGPVLIACGRGNNGGDGFVIARHLDLRGYAVRVVLCCSPETLAGDAAANFSILRRCEIPVSVLETARDERLDAQLAGADWIVDALLGTGAVGEPRPPLDSVIARLNQHPAKRLAVDIPSGLDCDSGQPAARTLRADVTCTFVAAKPGFLVDQAQPFLGSVRVLDIGAPRALLERFGWTGQNQQ